MFFKIYNQINENNLKGVVKMYKIAVIPGDGIGKEVIAEGVKLMKDIESLGGPAFELTEYPWSCGYYLENGKMADDDFLDTLKGYDAIYLGAIGDPAVKDHIALGQFLLKLRREFDEYVNLRPIKLLNVDICPLKNITSTGQIDITVVRENSEGEYANVGARLFEGRDDEMALQTGVFSKKGTERIMRYAFELARKEHKTLTSISKGNALGYSMVFWDETFQRIAKEYPDVETHTCLVDAASMFFVKNPERFQIVVTSNLFGDIITDLGAAIAGGMGLAAGANINPERTYPSMFEPIHGSAPDIAGQGKADPMAALWSVSQMLDHFGHEDLGRMIIEAIKMVIDEKQVVPFDLGGQASTTEVGEAVREKFAEIYKKK